MKAKVKALDILLEKADCLLLLIEGSYLPMSVLSFFAPNVCLKHSLLTINVNLVDLKGNKVIVVVAKAQGVEMTSFCQY